jgi:hypothetical protein
MGTCGLSICGRAANSIMPPIILGTNLFTYVRRTFLGSFRSHRLCTCDGGCEQELGGQAVAE